MLPKGKKLYLNEHEQIESGYSSPIDLNTFDAEVERDAANAALDVINAQQMSAPDDEYFLGSAQRDLVRWSMRLRIADCAIKSATEALIPDLVKSGIEQLEELLNTEDPKQ